MAKDPVCGTDVEERTAARTSVYKGQTYYFCCRGCKADFDKDPEKYVAKKSGMEHGGHGHGMHH